MAYSPEERAEVLEYYFNNDVSLRETIKRFGYPSLECISQWVEKDPRYDEARFHKRVKYPYETRRAALKLLYEDELSFDEIALRLGIRNASSIADWKVAYEKGGMLALMPKNQMPKYSKDFKKKGKEPPEDIDELKARIEALQLENDVLRATLEVLKKDPGLSASDLTNREKVLVIDALRPRYRLSKLLTQLEIAKSSYHYAKASGLRPDKRANERILLREIFEESRRTYGYRRLWWKLRAGGLIVSEKVIRRLMAEEGLTVISQRKKRYGSYRGVVGRVADNILDRQFSATMPNQKWATDITEFRVGEERVYLSPVIDLFNGEIISHAASRRPGMELVLRMLKKATARMNEGEVPLLHSDQGHHYQRRAFVQAAENHGIVQSMSRKGCCLDNAVMESFFGHLKSEFFYNREFEDADELIAGIDDWIDWYNDGRIKVKLGGMSPVRYRQDYESSAA